MTGSTAGAACELVIDSPGRETARVHLDGESYRVGRSSANELSFPADHALSREHLVFENTAEGWTVRDAGSRNGTRVNGARITAPVCLAHGDQITAGHLTIRYAAHEELPDPKTHDVLFVAEPELAAASVSVDLKSALEKSTDLAGQPTLGNVHLGALVRAGRELAGHSSLEDLFQLILDLSLDAVKASRGVVMTREADGNLRSRAIRGENLRISTTVRDRVLHQPTSLLVRDAALDAAFARQQSIIAQQIRSFLAVPLQTGEEVIGLIYLDSPQLIEFTVEDLNLLTVMANIAAIRIEHARLIEAEQAKRLLDRELERAAEIQRSLLPVKAPNVAGFDLAVYNTPCRTVGGDYYDFLPYADGRITIVIADVSGKGMPAALLMSSLQARMQVLFEKPDELAKQVARLNRITAANCPNNCFISLFVAVLDLATGEMRYCNAGHNPPLLLHKNQEVERLEATGMVLGIFPSGTYEERACRLDTEELLLLFSDGITEAANSDRDEEFGDERLIALMKREPRQGAAEFIEELKTELSSFAGPAAALDDMTAVAVRRL
ncbi:MAG: SpoIIE family protein phosphatase [Acidobacteriaceae bacterium]|nr:SpoIIE family protein phosphatase [Acidobacteriaceae bacterium]